MRLGHDLRQHVEPAAVGHADDDVFDAERAAALDDLLERRDHRFAAVEAEALGAGELEVAELLEALRLDQLVEDGALALAGEADLLVGPFDALLHPAFLRRIGDVHELDAERLAIGAAQDGEDLAQAAELEPEHAVEEDLAVVVGVREAIGARIELLLVPARLEPERVEIGVEMAARPVGADQHQGANRITRRLLHVGGRELDAARLRARLDLVADRPLHLGPVAVERGDQLPARSLRPIRPLPGRPAGALLHVGAVVLEALEESLPFGIDRVPVGLVAGVEVLDVVGVAAIKERRAGEGGIGVLAGHAWVPVGWGVVGPHYDRRHESSGPFTFILFMLQLRCDNWQKMNSNSRADGAVAQPAHASPVQGARGQKGGFRRLAVTRCLLRARRGLRLSLPSGRASRGPSGLTGFSAAISISRRPGCRPSGS